MDGSESRKSFDDKGRDERVQLLAVDAALGKSYTHGFSRVHGNRFGGSAPMAPVAAAVFFVAGVAVKNADYSAGNPAIRRWRFAVARWNLADERWNFAVDRWSVDYPPWSSAICCWNVADADWSVADSRWSAAVTCWSVAVACWNFADEGWSLADSGWNVAVARRSSCLAEPVRRKDCFREMGNLRLAGGEGRLPLKGAHKIFALKTRRGRVVAEIVKFWSVRTSLPKSDDFGYVRRVFRTSLQRG
jgi:hypothetical protein